MQAVDTSLRQSVEGGGTLYSTHGLSTQDQVDSDLLSSSEKVAGEYVWV